MYEGSEKAKRLKKLSISSSSRYRGKLAEAQLIVCVSMGLVGPTQVFNLLGKLFYTDLYTQTTTHTFN